MTLWSFKVAYRQPLRFPVLTAHSTPPWSARPPQFAQPLHNLRQGTVLVLSLYPCHPHLWVLFLVVLDCSSLDVMCTTGMRILFPPHDLDGHSWWSSSLSRWRLWYSMALSPLLCLRFVLSWTVSRSGAPIIGFWLYRCSIL